MIFMNKMPPHIAIVIVWGVLLGYLIFDFIEKANVNFVQFNYNWDASEVLENLGGVEIDSISHDYVSFKNNFRLPDKFNNNNTFLLKTNQESYFRASEILVDTNEIIFSGVKWINQIPNKKSKRSSFEVIDLPLIQPKGKTTMTLGDSQIIWHEGRELRRNLLRKKKLFMVGNQSDIYGYPYEGGTFDTSSDILKKIPNTPAAEYCILFFGAQDKGLEKELLDENIYKILRLLQNTIETESIFAITLPPSTNQFYNEYNNNFNTRLKQCATQFRKVQIVDFNSFLKDKKDYLSKDEVHLNKKGYLYLNKLLTQEIP
jgi:xanthosine utilization system XapX-like protein